MLLCVCVCIHVHGCVYACQCVLLLTLSLACDYVLRISPALDVIKWYACILHQSSFVVDAVISLLFLK